MVRARVVVAMSGGVDSSVAALRLVAAGHEVVGVTLHLWDYPDNSERGRCCAPEDQYDARRVADHLKIPHYTFDRRSLFKETVVDPFVSAYLEGRTPSPCVSCNRTVKMRELFSVAGSLGATTVATGHYARVLSGGDGRAPRLCRGTDRGKDQSYFLHMLTPDELGRVAFPLGGSTKKEVRDEALAHDLPGAKKGESQELCFVTSGRYEHFVLQRADGRVRPGQVLDHDGRVLGDHEGVHRFTVGQRKGLGVATGKPAYVTGIDAGNGTVHVGPEEGLFADEAELDPESAAFQPDVTFPRPAIVQVRARHAGAPATIHREEGRLWVRFDEPVRAISPGQVAVAYEEDRVLGGATIVRGRRTARLTEIEAVAATS